MPRPRVHEAIARLKQTGRSIEPGEKPLRVGLSKNGLSVSACFPATSRPAAARVAGVSSSFVRIGLAATRTARDHAVLTFVERHGLLRSPFDRTPHRMIRAGSHVEYKEPIAEYLRLSKLFSSILRTRFALGDDRRRVEEVDVRTMAAFLRSDLSVDAAIRRARFQLVDEDPELFTKLEEPVPADCRVRLGDRREKWRDLQRHRMVEAVNRWISVGQVRPTLAVEGMTIRGDQWTGGAWGSLAGALHAALVGLTPLRNCDFCGRTYEGGTKRPRLIYRGQRVRHSCPDPACRRAKRGQ